MMQLIVSIKQFPARYIHTIRSRSYTTPNATNRMNHLLLISAIENEQWEQVHVILSTPSYKRPLHGVLCCLNFLDYDESFTPEYHGKLIDDFGMSL